MELPHPRIGSLLRESYDAASFQSICELLASAGTLRIPRLETGLFAAASTTEFSQGTNYHSTWVRDTVHVAYAHFANGQPAVAAKAAAALCQFFRTQEPRLRDVIKNPALKADPMRRPHIRFNGDTLQELSQQWAHAQNDAIGYFLWLTTTLCQEQVLPLGPDDVSLLQLFPQYLAAIEYWADEDSGHWEETRKIEASSIGPVVAGLRKLQALWPSATTQQLIARGEQALCEILPAECRQPDPAKSREYDSALLFLIYPLGVVSVDSPMAETIVTRTVENLLGPVGIKRYLKDSFYCNDYESLIAAAGDDPTRDFSNDQATRDAMLKPNAEAQWCLFDPIISVIYGQRYLLHRRSTDHERQTFFLNRSLRQITVSDPPRCAELQCPELYYVERGKLQTSKAVPLLWTQANLWTALTVMEQALAT
ncbi:MAG: phosphorylase kinase [Planctomycetes bacterium]|nr:phosphorylase kinase [Planctomycetota bacterium]